MTNNFTVTSPTRTHFITFIVLFVLSILMCVRFYFHQYTPTSDLSYLIVLLISTIYFGIRASFPITRIRLSGSQILFRESVFDKKMITLLVSDVINISTKTKRGYKGAPTKVIVFETKTKVFTFEQNDLNKKPKDIIRHIFADNI